jgi:hypothetical protein
VAEKAFDRAIWRRAILGESNAKQQGRPRGGLSLNHLPLLKNSGAGEGIRTLDPDLGKVVLYH